jgi:rhodanese-related sulfurtransferase
MKTIPIIALMLIAGLVTSLHALTALTAENVPRITTEALRQQLNSPDMVIIDVRTPHDWQVSATKIKGSVREDASTVAAWIAKYSPNKTLIFYCT